MAVIAESENAHHALERAALLELAPEARVALLMRHGEGHSGPLGARLGPSGEKLAAHLQASGGHLSLISLSEGEDTTAALERHGEQPPPELVLVAHESKGLLTRLFGATPEKLARHYPVPLLITQRPAEHPYRRILVGIDYSELSHRVLELALRLKGPGAEALDVLHCYDGSYALVLHQTGAPSEKVVAYYRERHAQAEARLRDFLRPYLEGGTDLHLQVRSGDPRTDLEEAAREQGTELLVVGRHVRQGLGQALQGSVAQACLKRAGCDVLIVPEAQGTWH